MFKRLLLCVVCLIAGVVLGAWWMLNSGMNAHVLAQDATVRATVLQPAPDAPEAK